MTDVRACKDALARLADDDPVTRATAAVDDLRAAARFAEEVGLDALAAAVDGAEGERAARGREALIAFRRFRATAAGERLRSDGSADEPAVGDSRSEGGDHFRRGHDTHLGRAFQAGANDTGDSHR